MRALQDPSVLTNIGTRNSEPNCRSRSNSEWKVRALIYVLGLYRSYSLSFFSIQQVSESKRANEASDYIH